MGLADERIEDVELVCRAGEPTLFELTRHRDQSLGCCRQLLSRNCATPRIRPRAAVGEHPTREDEARLILGPQLDECLELAVIEEFVGQVELGFDVRLGAGRPDRRSVTLDAEEESDRLREDRLARACLAAQDVEPRLELELSLSNQDEVLDPEATKHRGDRRPGARVSHLPRVAMASERQAYELPKLWR